MKNSKRFTVTGFHCWVGHYLFYNFKVSSVHLTCLFLGKIQKWLFFFSVTLHCSLLSGSMNPQNRQDPKNRKVKARGWWKVMRKSGRTSKRCQHCSPASEAALSQPVYLHPLHSAHSLVCRRNKLLHASATKAHNSNSPLFAPCADKAHRHSFRILSFHFCITLYALTRGIMKKVSICQKWFLTPYYLKAYF